MVSAKENEIFNLNTSIYKLRDELELRKFESKEVMTDVDMRNLDFLEKAETVYNSKKNDTKEFFKCL